MTNRLRVTRFTEEVWNGESWTQVKQVTKREMVNNTAERISNLKRFKPTDRIKK